MINVTFQQEPVTLVGQQVKVGDKAPSFSVLSNDLKEVTLEDYEGKVKLISVVPSIDTGVCSLQTKRFNERANEIDNVQVLTLSMDLPFAQTRWAEENNIKHVKMLSDHKLASFGKNYGTLIEELRLLTRSIFVINAQNEVTYVEYVSEVTDHPNYDQAIQAVKECK